VTSAEIEAAQEMRMSAEQPQRRAEEPLDGLVESLDRKPAGLATQLWDGDPPQVWETAVRLRDAGYERHEVLHMLGRSVSDQIWAALHDNQPYDRARQVAALRALPGSWDRERSALSAAQKHDDARKQARRSARAARRRNRRPN
jgi:hypothetical protein